MDSVHLSCTVEELGLLNDPRQLSGQKLGEIALDPIEDIPGLCQRIAAVIRENQAEIIGIQEGPPRADQK